MSEVAIRVENLSKRYRIGERESYKALRDVIADSAAVPFRRMRSILDRRPKPIDGNNGSNGHPSSVIRQPSTDGAVAGPSSSTSIWALDDVSFEVKRGEVVGIIGRNGAGKSTLLKILSRITKPTKGHAKIYGRVGSLLEVGTGFHPELTGRENIYLNGAILGMRKAEIERKFDEIVAFAEVEKFIDTPVKRYSSGMYVRLAFAVAAHMETEVLIVDEVLSVGDAEFQKKSLGKMGDVAKAGRTVLFVSHDMSAITRLSDRAILLNSAIEADGPSSSVVKTYLDMGGGVIPSREWNQEEKWIGNHVVRLVSAKICTKLGEAAAALDIREPIGIEVVYDVLEPEHLLIPNFHVFNDQGFCLFALQDVRSEWRTTPRPVGRQSSTAWIPGNFLAEGKHIVGIAVSSHIPKSIVHVYEPAALAFEVLDKHDGDSARGDFIGQMPGLIRPVVEWTHSGTNRVR